MFQSHLVPLPDFDLGFVASLTICLEVVVEVWPGRLSYVTEDSTLEYSLRFVQVGGGN
jgi:hypothetical protein